MSWIQFLSLPVLGMIAWEDLRERSIHWWWLPVLAAVLLLPSCSVLSSDDQAARIGFNLLFLGLQLGATFLYLLIRHGAWVNPVDRFIGLGDVLFFVVLALGLSRSNFIVFLLTGLAFCVPAYLLLIRLHSSTPRTVPTAGFLALYLGLWCALDLLGIFPDLTTGSVAEHLLAHAG
jgi:hypothetical protein